MISTADEIQHQAIDATQVKDWRIMANKILLYDDYEDERSLRNDYQKFQEMPIDQQRVSNWKSVEIFGFDNKTRYEKMLSKYLRTPIDDDMFELRYTPQERIRTAFKEYALHEDLITAIKTATYLEDSGDKKTAKEIKDNIYDKMERDNNINIGLSPYYTAKELAHLGVSYLPGLPAYSNTPDNVMIGSISTTQWIQEYKNICMGVKSDKYVNINTWKNTLDKLYDNYEYIKTENDPKKLLDRKQSILDLGWNPEIDFNEITTRFASKRISDILKEEYSMFKLIDIHYDPTYIEESINDENVVPLYIILYCKNTPNPYCFNSVGVFFNDDPNTVYSYNISSFGTNQNMTKTSIKFIKSSSSDAEIYAVMIPKDKIDSIKERITNTKYIPTKIYNDHEYIYNNKMICSNCICYLMNNSNAITKGDIFNCSYSGNIYKIFSGNINDYDILKLRTVISPLYEDSNLMSIVEENDEFPIQFTKDGDLLISKGKDIDFEGEYSRCHLAMVQYEKAKNVKGMEYCMCKLWYLNILLEENIHDHKNNKEKLKEYHKARAKILNDINKYMPIILKHDPNFDILKAYQNSPFNDNNVRIRRSTLLYTIDLFKKVILG
jgi:hypothetical protein